MNSTATKTFREGDVVQFNAGFTFKNSGHCATIAPGDYGIVDTPKFPDEKRLVTVCVEGFHNLQVTVPVEILDLIRDEDGDEDEITIPDGFILLHDDASGEPVLYRGGIIDGFGDGYVILKDGTEFDCEESVWRIAEQMAKGMKEGWMI